ncbi:hypothetical protein [Sulfuricella denitrificans]|uniref:hypothetical protein n=1 Tax=Sulfuricella denitrificans TaxID=649841 RepID=UPI001E62070A|nr:hypothetical protein [Sulfuricella denitrificans]
MMTSQNLANLAKTGQLKAEAPSRKEFDGLVRSACARLKDAHIETLPMLWHWRPCAGMATARKIVTLFFNVCNIRWILAQRIGGYWRCAMSAATLRNTKDTWKSMNN